VKGPIRGFLHFCRGGWGWDPCSTGAAPEAHARPRSGHPTLSAIKPIPAGAHL